jgi:hypothetical protein
MVYWLYDVMYVCFTLIVHALNNNYVFILAFKPEITIIIMNESYMMESALSGTIWFADQ